MRNNIYSYLFLKVKTFIHMIHVYTLVYFFLRRENIADQRPKLAIQHGPTSTQPNSITEKILLKKRKAPNPAGDLIHSTHWISPTPLPPLSPTAGDLINHGRRPFSSLPLHTPDGNQVRAC